MLGRLRDFERADLFLTRAEALHTSPWLCNQRAELLLLEDRQEEALKAAEQSLTMRPWYRPGVQMAAHLLVQQELDSEDRCRLWL